MTRKNIKKYYKNERITSAFLFTFIFSSKNPHKYIILVILGKSSIFLVISNFLNIMRKYLMATKMNI